MEIEFSEEKYENMLAKLFVRFPSFQKDGASAYKPGIANMEFIDQLMGHPHRNYRIIHVAGTNGKGSVSNMLASSLASQGLKVGLYTSPHITDFRERMRVVEISPRTSFGRDDNSSDSQFGRDDNSSDSQFGRDDNSVISSESERRVEKSHRYVSKQYVWDFVNRWQDTFDHLDLSFCEITTIMALQWFADEGVDVVVLETGLGGRLDSTNIVTPELCVITNIGLDHCDMLGDTLGEIAFEKAGIIKPRVPVVIGESHPEIDSVFERKVLYTNLPDPYFMGNRNAIMSLLTFADMTEPKLWSEHEQILSGMDLQGEYQRKNLRTVLAALEVFGIQGAEKVKDALINTAGRTGFRGRWEVLSESPLTICDIGHNEHGLRHNFAQLARMKDGGAELIIVYGSVADKDVDSVMHLMPEGATYIFTQAQSKRALAAEKVSQKYQDFCAANGRDAGRLFVKDTVESAVALAQATASDVVAKNPEAQPVIYIGGSTYVVSEAVVLF